MRIEAVRALVSVDDADGVAAAAVDANREVRIAVANGLGTLRTGRRGRPRTHRRPRPAGARRRAGGDGLDRLGRRRRDDRRARAGRVGVADPPGRGPRAGRAPSPTAAVPPLSRALSDPHLDVRKAAVLSLTRWASSETPPARR